ncbi:MAG: MFS transporter [Victivallaceae bacterium]|jgi:Na+/melibiose symporter-like transporter
MMTFSNTDQPAATKTYHCGTLTYTKAGLFAIFAWLLWGDFCITLMEAVVPSVLPLKLKSLGCSNWMMGLILSSIPGVLNMTICPYVSFKSDRYRSRWGRRLPFIIWTLPFLCISLFMLGWSDEIRVFLQRCSPALNEYAPATVTIGLIAFFMMMFQFFNMFVNSVFWYLFNDVVPAQFIGRFVGLLRIVSTLAATLYNYFIFRYAESHMREIFLGAAVLYFIGFGLLCMMVKEGEYPPVEGEQDKDNKGIGGIKTYFREAFSHKLYWLIFAAAGFQSIAGAMYAFNIFFNREMGLPLAQIGTLAAVNGVVAMVAMYCTAIFVDRWHPMRIVTYITVFNVSAMISSSWVWVFVTLPGDYYFWLGFGGAFIGMFQGALINAATFPRQMRTFPQSRFGQFCSAQAMVQSLCNIGAGVGAGLFIDLVRYFCHGSDFAYRFNFVWITFFSGISAIIAIYIYIIWYRLGGDEHFHPPAPWSPKQVEEMAITQTIGPQTRWMKLAFRIFDALIALSVLGVPCMMWWMYHKQAMFAYKWFGILLLPLSILAWLWWQWLKRSISSDMARARNGDQLRNGIPHHGMLIVVGAKYLLALGLWITQVIIAVNLNMETGAIVFGLANVVTNFMIIGIIQIMCRVERGYSITIDVVPARAA